MKRIPEPELMDTEIQAKVYSDADFSSSDEALMKRLKRYISESPINIDNQSLIVDLGCGPGNITERLAVYWPNTTVIGIDGAKAMLDIARDRKEGNSADLSLVEYLLSDIATFANGLQELESLADVIVTNSFLHHLHDPSVCWKAIKKMSVPGAVVLVRDLRRPISLSQALQLRDQHLPEAPSVLRKDFLASLKAAFSLDEVKKQLEEEGLTCLKVSEVDDFYLEVLGTVCPTGWE